MRRLLAVVALLGVGFAGFPAEEPALPTLPFAPERASVLREEWAKSLGLDGEFTNSLGMKLVLICGGQFEMGGNGSRRRVTLSRAFYIGTTEVTLGQYRKFKPGHQINGSPPEFNKDDLPAAMLSWNDAREFCAWLNEHPDEKKAGRVYSLPTEAQWEWAARAGTVTSRHFGDTDKGQADFSWYNVTATANPMHEEKGRGRQPVGKLKPNAWGLYDMLGNVWEWCEDRRGDEVTGETRDPVMRGGSWRSEPSHCTSAAHDPGDPDQKGDSIGFRIVCRIVKKG